MFNKNIIQTKKWVILNKIFVDLYDNKNNKKK